MINANEAKNMTDAAQIRIKHEAIMREIEKAEKFVLFAEKSIEFCDTVLSTLIKDATEKGQYKIEFYCGALAGYCCDYDNTYQATKADGTVYANGKKSYDTYGPKFHLPTVIEYLKANGYEVSEYNMYYMCYGSGECKGKQLFISWTN